MCFILFFLSPAALNRIIKTQEGEERSEKKEEEGLWRGRIWMKWGEFTFVPGELFVGEKTRTADGGTSKAEEKGSKQHTAKREQRNWL